jgi:TetR/AcrR family transcriptional regulator, ethionamide resistance regulator
VTVPAARHARLSHGRRNARLSGDNRERAILATAEHLLEQRPLADISVDDLAKGAGISRSTFYFYFPSKDAVLLTLLERMITEADAALENLNDRDNTWRRGINAAFQIFGSQSRGVSRAGWAALATNPEVRQLWSTFMQKCVRHTAAVIEAQRARGAAPETLPAEDLATVLNQMNERVLAASFAADEPSVPPARMVDTLVHVWVASIYGEAR